MTAKTLEDVKKVDERSKKRIFGYIRKIEALFECTIPTLVIHWCLLYYFVDDEFSDYNLGPGYELGDNKKIMKLTTLQYGSVYLTNIVEYGVHRWKFRILQVNGKHYYMTIGVSKTKAEIDRGTRVDNYFADDGYGWIVNYQRTTQNRNKDCGDTVFMGRPKYGIKDCESGDIIEMTLDLNDRTLYYSVNKENWGVAFSDIEMTSYRAVVSANKVNDSIELISYQQLE